MHTGILTSNTEDAAFFLGEYPRGMARLYFIVSSLFVYSLLTLCPAPVPLPCTLFTLTPLSRPHTVPKLPASKLTTAFSRLTPISPRAHPRIASAVLCLAHGMNAARRRLLQVCISCPFSSRSFMAN